MPERAAPPAIKTDAIVVLTGGSARVERGFDMLAAGAAPVMLISGVGKEVTLLDMIGAHASIPSQEAIRANGAAIVLDHVADTTQTNAREAANFVRERGYRSIRLITANYHMRRSMAEFKAALPEVAVVPDAVNPEHFRRDQWWRHQNTRRLVLSEFHKYFAVKLRPLLAHIQ